VRLIPWGVESEAASLVLPAKPILWERSPNYLDHSLCGVESEAVSLVLPTKPTLWERSPNYLDPSPWGVKSEAASLVLPAKPTLREGFSPIILVFLCGV
jgi:hypothetical protein